MTYRANVGPEPGTIVSIAPDLTLLQAPDGSMVPIESLGPGVVKRVEQDGRVSVYWLEANFDSCLDPGDVRLMGQDAHVVSVYRHNEQGPAKLRKHMVVADAGLLHNWTVELWSSNIVRAIRNSDGAAWTFSFNWMFNRIEVWWPQPPDDDDAEALVAAEAATEDK